MGRRRFKATSTPSLNGANFLDEPVACSVGHCGPLTDAGGEGQAAVGLDQGGQGLFAGPDQDQSLPVRHVAGAADRIVVMAAELDHILFVQPDQARRRGSILTSPYLAVDRPQGQVP